jgi:hypothetical protein
MNRGEVRNGSQDDGGDLGQAIISQVQGMQSAVLKGTIVQPLDLLLITTGEEKTKKKKSDWWEFHIHVQNLKDSRRALIQGSLRGIHREGDTYLSRFYRLSVMLSA